jgi:hypothetical protein
VNDETGRHARSAHSHRRASYRAWSALDELERERFLQVDPGSSRTWRFVPATLRRDYADGRVSPDEFWRRAALLIEFDSRRRAA